MLKTLGKTSEKGDGEDLKRQWKTIHMLGPTNLSRPPLRFSVVL